MIDEEKIQEVSSNDANFLYSEWNNPCKDAYKRGFKAAIHWLRSSLWHCSDEKPQSGEQCLVDMEFLYEDAPEDNYRTYITSTYGEWGWTEDHMPREATHFKLYRWCYIKDLLEGGEQ